MLKWEPSRRMAAGSSGAASLSMKRPRKSRMTGSRNWHQNARRSRSVYRSRFDMSARKCRQKMGRLRCSSGSVSISDQRRLRGDGRRLPAPPPPMPASASSPPPLVAAAPPSPPPWLWPWRPPSGDAGGGWYAVPSASLAMPNDALPPTDAEAAAAAAETLSTRPLPACPASSPSEPRELSRSSRALESCFCTWRVSCCSRSEPSLATLRKTSSSVVTPTPYVSSASSDMRTSRSEKRRGNMRDAVKGSWKASSAPTSLSTLASRTCDRTQSATPSLSQPSFLTHVRW
mmetsp:Transcript_6528/g.23272  ORF Transcript_6528/g.23272 Transcript_6528/m.23272 type:complete len:288 (-) Transcript_6528:864-1727(-)